MDTENKIELKVGDVFRMNKGRKEQIVVSVFEYNGENIYVHHYLEEHNKGLCRFEATSEKYLCGVNSYYGNVWGGIVEINGKVVRGKVGKLITPKDVKPKEETKKVENAHLTDFQKFIKVQNGGMINMTDIVTGARLAGISEDKYVDIMWHYDDYKSGKRS